MFRSTAVVVALSATLLAPASASADNMADCSPKLEHMANKHRKQVINRHGHRAPGRDIIKYGVRFTYKGDTSTFRAVPSECHRYNRQLKRLLRAPRYPTLEREAVPPALPPAGVQSPGISAGPTLDNIAACESGGDPTAVSPDGTYRGKYQFDYGTWASVGGSGDPAAASEAEQDMRAAMLMAQRGNNPWPVCG